jgi:hypothetical protein
LPHISALNFLSLLRLQNPNVLLTNKTPTPATRKIMKS